CEDCQRDLTVVLNPEMLTSVLPPLSLLLQSLRWVWQATAQAFREEFDKAYEEIAFKLKSDKIPAADFWALMTQRISSAPPPRVIEVEHLFQEKWKMILSATTGASFLQFKSCLLKY